MIEKIVDEFISFLKLSLPKKCMYLKTNIYMYVYR
jgi:hypothetical protein